MTQRTALREAIKLLATIDNTTDIIKPLEALANQLDKHQKRASELHRTKQEEKRD